MSGIDNELPPVSCMCLTYGRPHILEEAIESFLRQDYQGVKELIVLNDLKEQKLTFDHPEVKIINLDQRFHSIGEKRNACASLSSHDYLFVWDDDDIFLPHRISYTISMMTEPFLNRIWGDFFKPTVALILNEKTILRAHRDGKLYHSGAAYTRKTFDYVRGYEHKGRGEDSDFERRVAEIKFDGIQLEDIYYGIKLKDVYYIYRFWYSNSYHIRDYSQDGATCNTQVGNFVKEQLQKREIKTGDILLNPHWEQDYIKLKEDIL